MFGIVRGLRPDTNRRSSLPVLSACLSRSSRAGQNRKPPRENQPFLSQFLKTGLCWPSVWRSTTTSSPEQPSRDASGKSHAIFAEPDCESPRSPSRREVISPNRALPRPDPRAASNATSGLAQSALATAQRKLAAKPNARRPRKPEPLRLRYAGRRGFRHPWAAGVCDRAGGGG